MVGFCPTARESFYLVYQPETVSQIRSWFDMLTTTDADMPNIKLWPFVRRADG